MVFAVVRSEADWTPGERLHSARAPGRGLGRLAGGHIDDIASLKKAVALCADCAPKFNPRAYGYITKKNLPLARGRCDGCDRHCDAHLFVHQSLADNC